MGQESAKTLSPADAHNPRLLSALALFALLSVLGNEAGAVLRYPDVGSAVLFPPYAVLTAALVVTRRREWVFYLLVASVAHMATHWPQWSLSWVLLADVANVARALCAAVLLRRVFGGDPRVKGIDGFVQFVAVAGLVAPAVGATIGAANVMLHGASQTYWLPWRAWFVSNALTGLTMLPALVLVLARAASWRRRRIAGPRLAEAMLLAVILGASCVVAFLAPDSGRWDRALLFYAPLPVLIWAALRFGAAGASLALTVVAFAAIGAADRATGPFFATTPDDVLTLQVFVLLTTIPVLCIAAVDSARQDSHARALELAGRLITAQEQERRRIGRDLHDDLNQQVAALSIALSSLGRRLPEGTDLRGEVARLEGGAQDLSEAVRGLSHELHPVVLDHAGLVPALRSYCRELGDRYEMTLSLPEEIGKVPTATGLSLYRAAQEALHNVIKHSRARGVRVAIEREDGLLALSIADDGCGFDVAEARRRGGLGLVSLEERARLAGGRLTITSRPQHGTEVRIVVPLSEA